eukprot:GILK01008236.1.p1 GENE.GILK01008236.1~~GILK01008236.1.p1  ORF type:complete len:399 (+),score=50.40 GILK01008236.1:46-1197(+)
MKSRHLGRLELLSWLNDFVEADYAKVEHLSDGIAFAQMLDAIYPGQVAIHKLNLNARHEDDFARNLRLVEEWFKKHKIDRILSIPKLSKGKFQENMDLLQWMYNYVMKNFPLVPDSYSGYQRRLEAYGKQQKAAGRLDPISDAEKLRMNPHLIPNKAALRQMRLSYDDRRGDVMTSSVSSAATVSNNPRFRQEANGQVRDSIPAVQVSLFDFDDNIPSQSTQPRTTNTRVSSSSSTLNRLYSFSDATSEVPQDPHSIAMHISTPTPSVNEKQAPPLSARTYLSHSTYPQSSVQAVSQQHESNDDAKREAELQDLVAALESELTTRLAKQRLFIEELAELQEERDFYFAKLRRVEEICTATSGAYISDQLSLLLTDIPSDFEPT